MRNRVNLAAYVLPLKLTIYFLSELKRHPHEKHVVITIDLYQAYLMANTCDVVVKYNCMNSKTWTIDNDYA